MFLKFPINKKDPAFTNPDLLINNFMLFLFFLFSPCNMKEF